MKDSLTRVTLAATTAALLTFSGPASATVSRFLELYEHTELSQLVVRATTGSATRAFVGKDGIPRIETEFRVLETYKGDAKRGDSLWLRQFGGGQLGVLPVVGDANFTPGAEVVLFLVRGEDDVVFLTALSQSKYDVVREEHLPIVKRQLGGLSFYESGKQGGLFGIADDVPVSLELFGEAVRELAAPAAP